MEDRENFFKSIEKPPKERTGEDLDIICLQIKPLIAFQKFSSLNLNQFALDAVLERRQQNDKLFTQGEEGDDWFVIFEGIVDIMVDDQLVVSFGSGNSFGEVAIIENKSRTATVIAQTDCILFKLAGNIYKTIYKDILATQTQHDNLDESREMDENEELNETIEEEESNDQEPLKDEETQSIKRDDSADDLSIFNFTRRGSLDTLKDLRQVLDLKPEERNADDLLDLNEEISHIKAFSHLSSSVLRELCYCISSEYLEPETILFKQGDEGTCWYVIYKGKVDVIVNGVTVCTLGEGQGFGDLALINDKPRSATIKGAGTESVHLIKVEKNDYNRILKDIESNTIRLEEHGKEVLVLEKRNDPGTKTSGYIIMAATTEKLVKQLEENNEADPTLPIDFFMSYRIFMTAHQVMDALMARLQTTADDGEGDGGKTKPLRQKKIASILRLWITNHAIDFTSDPTLIDKLVEVLDILEKEGQAFERNKVISAMELKRLDTKDRKSGQASAVDSTASYQGAALRSEEIGQVTLRKRTSVKGFLKKGFGRLSIRSSSRDSIMEIPQEEPMSSTNLIPTKDCIKVYKSDETYKTIEVDSKTSGLDLLTAALNKFSQPGEAPLELSDFDLVEFKSDGTIRPIEHDELSVVSKMTLNGKFFIKKKGENLESPAEVSSRDTIFLELETTELVRILTLMDHQMFCKIDPLEFIYHIYKVKGQDTTNLHVFVNQFNKINYWVVTEICTQLNLPKRVLIIKKFIKMAVLCKALNNYNSLFAILSGLSNVAVSRMQSTWRKIPSKLIAEYENLTKLMDPSRNMKNYRTHLLNATPPLVPFFPIVIKDLFFIHECNSDKTSTGLVNFDKIRLLTSIIRFVDAFRYIPYDPNIQATYDPKKRRSTLEVLNETHLEKAHEVHQVKEYLTTLQVVDDMRVLSRISRDVEAPQGRTKRSASIPRIILGL